MKLLPVAVLLLALLNTSSAVGIEEIIVLENGNPDETTTTKVEATTTKVEATTTKVEATTAKETTKGETTVTTSKGGVSTTTGGGTITTEEPHTAETEATGSTIENVQTTTEAPETTTTTPTIPPTVILPKQNFSLVCKEKRCAYKMQLPTMSRAFLATAESILATERSEVDQNVNDIENLEKMIAISTYEKEVSTLEEQILDAQKKLNELSAAVDKIRTNTMNAQSNLALVQKVIGKFSKDPTSCLYAACLAPPTTTSPPPPTTTPVPTTQDPCTEFGCENGGECRKTNGPPQCFGCPGNTDGTTEKCHTSICSTNVLPQSLGPMVSPGWSASKSGESIGYNTSMTCIWKVTNPKKGPLYLNEDFLATSFSNMDTTAKLTFQNGARSFDIIRTTKAKLLNAALEMATEETSTFTFTTSTTGSAEGFHFAFALTDQKPSSAGTVMDEALLTVRSHLPKWWPSFLKF